ncbi:prohibitin family protein [Thermoflexibacter ruber]|uniref:Regulator of protease activity HflC, stomatin/prohibitin superfamily n=1 Tax=Thermoflexibacter ruber TaxID=1003 RepID=A0A1I2JL48_9BACT|nr:prohibitin family protein [Thermoflexibacter ruber]SFF54848.1 Regulator of protease activity HflC, stomatin/prohibitin superfamily [Thermoflexibacter ruber]
MKRGVIAIVIVVLVGILGFSTVSCTRIDAGHVGIKVNLYGSDKGVQDIVEVSGVVWYNPLTTQIFEFPTYVQHKVWTMDMTEDSPRNEEFTVTTRDGLSLSFDVGLDYTVVASKVPDIFRTYRKSLPQITDEFIRTLVRNSYNNTASKYTAEDMVSKRSEYELQVKDVLSKDMAKAGFEVSQVAILGKIRMPATLEEAVNAKIKAVQEAIRAENEKQRIIAEAQKAIEEAKGKAEALRIASEAEANANRAVTSTISPLLIQKMMIEKWDGKLPVYGEVPKMFRNISDQK